MKNTKLSQRQKNIIRMFPHKDNSPITVKDIADKLNLSTRTVQRDLIGIEKFFLDNHFEFVKKPGIGIILNEDEDSIDFMYELLDMIDSSKQYGRNERINFILSRLLTSNQPIKYYAFTAYLDVSEKTLVEDLAHIEEWLKKSNLSLVKKRGEGVSIKGSENSLRKAQSRLINQVLDDDKKIELLKNINNDVKQNLIQDNDVLSMIDRSIIDRTRNALNTSFSELHISLSDNAYIGLVVHIALAIERLKKNESIEFKQDFIDNLINTQEYIFARKIVNNLEKEFDMDIPNDETSYIAMHIKGANFMASSEKQSNMDDVIEANQITKVLITEMEKIFNLNLTDDKRLENDLKAHLSPAITRLKLNLSIRNPLLEEIKFKYDTIFNALMNIVPNVLIRYANIEESKVIPEDEIGFIAIHFITSIEKKIIDRMSINVITICPTGYGTSRLLATNLSNNLKNVNIVGNASIMNLNREFLIEKNVDLVISTVNLESILDISQLGDIPYIEVPTITSENDYIYINSKLAEISRQKYYCNELVLEKNKISNEIIPDNNKNKELSDQLYRTRRLFKISSSLSYLYDDIRFFNKKGIYDLVQLSASIVANTESEFVNIKSALEQRIKLGGIYFKEYKLHLMHANCDIENPKLAFGNLVDQNEILVIMISTKDYRSEIVNLFSNISTMIIENSRFIEKINSNEIQSVKDLVLNQILNIIDEEINKGE